jgi:protoheme IX farnesyltransferase
MNAATLTGHRAAVAARQVLSLFKLRIGVVIAITALGGVAVQPGPAPGFGELAALFACVLLASAAAGAFNQWWEADLDRTMRRTRNRPFATGALQPHAGWLALMVAMTALAGLAAWRVTNAAAAVYTVAGALVYAVVYTVWLKRRTWWNIVIGGLAGSFAVLAGAAAVTPGVPDPIPLAFAVILFLWTPPHFWSLAIAYRDDYAAARVPMLPVVIGDARAARAVLASASLLVAASGVPAFVGLGAVYLATALAGGAFLLAKAWALARKPNRRTAMASFHASLVQLTLLLLGAIVDVAVYG